MQKWIMFFYPKMFGITLEFNIYDSPPQIAEISTRTSLGSLPTSTVSLAGRLSLK
jgi:hypothetical protein